MKEEIQKFFKGEIEDDEIVLEKYSHDASIFEVKPKIILFPKDVGDIKNLVKWASNNKDKYGDPILNQDFKYLSLTCRCAGTDMSGAAVGESIIIDFTRHMNKLLSFPKNNGLKEQENIISVEPGMFYRDFEKITLERDLILPCYTASKSQNALGGMYGNNSAGEKTLKYGQTENYVVEAKVVFSDGNEYVVKPLSEEEFRKKISQNDFEASIYKNVYELIKNNKEEIKLAKPNVHKNSAGYYIWNVLNNTSSDSFFDLNKLLVGSQGTLCIVTEITFKLVKNPKNSKLVVVFLNDLSSLGRLIDEILIYKPETLETYDDKTMRLAVKFFFDFLKNKGFLGTFKFIWNFIPEFKMMINNGFPKLIMLVEFTGDEIISVEKQCLSLKEKLKNFNVSTHITQSERETEKYWDIRRESFSLLRKHVSGLHTAPFIDDVIVRPEFLPKFIPELNNLLQNYNLTYTIAGHAGDGNFHIIPLMDFSKDETRKIILELGEKVYDLVKKYKGSIAAEHNDGLVRTPYLNKMYDARIISLFKEIKNIFDPKGIFNLGKKVPGEDGSGTKEYLASHIVNEHNIIHRI